jgi:hypothetical protein
MMLERITARAIRSADEGKRIMVPAQSSVKIALVLIAVIMVQFAAAGQMAAQTFNAVQMNSQIEDMIYEELEKRIKGQFDDVNAKTKEWGQNAAFRATLQYFGKDSKAKELFLSARKDGKTPEQAFRLALKTVDDDNALAILKRFDAFVTSDGVAAVRDLQKVLSKGQSQIQNILKMSKEVEAAKDQDTYIALLKKYGVDGIDDFEVLEKRLTKLHAFIQNPYGKYSEIFTTIQTGIEGKEPGTRALALFTLMENTGSAIPVLGSFIENYAAVAKELLNATLRLRKAFAKWDMGCVGSGSYGGIRERNDSMRSAFKYATTACPDGSIKGLYLDWNVAGLLYFWDGKKWHRSAQGSGGLEAMRQIIDFLSIIKKQQPVVKNDVLTAFKFYGLPNGYAKARAEALTVHTGITENWDRLRAIMVSFDIPKDRIIQILEEQAGIKAGFETYLDKHFRTNQDIFVYLYLKSLTEGGFIASLHKDTFQRLRDFRPKIVLGSLELPDGLDLATVEPVIKINKSFAALVEKQSISLADKTYRIVLFGKPNAKVEYQVILGAFRSNVLTVDRWKNRFTQHRAVFKASLGVKLTLPDKIEVGQKVVVSGRITPDPQTPGDGFTLGWFVDGQKAGTKALSGEDFTIPLEFVQAGIHDFEVAVTDSGGISGGERADLPVAFKLEAELETGEDRRLLVKVKITGGGGDYAVQWRTDTGISLSKNTSRSKFFQRFEDTGAKPIKWIDLTVFDKNSRIEVPWRINVEGGVPVAVKLAVEPAVLTAGEAAEVFVRVQDGSPDYNIVLYSNKRQIGERQTSATGELFAPNFADPGEYQLRVVVTDSAGETANATATVTVKKPVIKVEDPEAEGLFATFAGNLDYKAFIEVPDEMVATGEPDENGLYAVEILSTRKLIDWQIVGSKLVFSIDGTAVSGRYTGERWNGTGAGDNNKKAFDCNVIGDYIPATEKVALNLDCPGFLGDVKGPPYVGVMTGDRQGNKFSGIWYFTYYGGGDWEATQTQALPSQAGADTRDQPAVIDECETAIVGSKKWATCLNADELSSQ